jgi:hypothetical protein
MIEPTPLLLIGLLADPAGSSSQPAAATATLTVADAVEDRPDLHAGRAHRPDRGLPRSQQASPAKVRSQLLAAKAEASPPKSSAASLPMPLRPASNPLIDAAKQLAAQVRALKKEI